jgi:plastocyanin
MITRLLATLLVATGLVAAPGLTGSPATAAGATVSVADMRFTPATVKVAVGSDVTWDFPDPMAHTTTSTQGFWNSGSKADGESYTRSFGSAGSYPYRCTFHPSMTGTVNVPVTRTGSASAGWRLTWASGRVDDTTYDVQTRKGGGAWKSLRTGTSATSAAFHKQGTWKVRARTHQGSAVSGWSPAVVVKTP